MAGHMCICVLLHNAGGPGCVSEVDVALRDARTVGRHGYPHRQRPSLWNGFPGKVGKDKAPDNGAVKDGGAGRPPLTVPPGDQRVPYLCGLDIPVAKPLHQRASLDNRLVETRHGGVGFQNEGKGTSTCISRLGRGPGLGFAMPTGG